MPHVSVSTQSGGITRDHLSTQKGPRTEALRGELLPGETPGRTAGRKWACARDLPPLPSDRKREESHPTQPDHVENGCKNQNHMHPRRG